MNRTLRKDKLRRGAQTSLKDVRLHTNGWWRSLQCVQVRAGPMSPGKWNHPQAHSSETTHAQDIRGNLELERAPPAEPSMLVWPGLGWLTGWPAPWGCRQGTGKDAGKQHFCTSWGQPHISRCLCRN